MAGDALHALLGEKEVTHGAETPLEEDSGVGRSELEGHSLAACRIRRVSHLAGSVAAQWAASVERDRASAVQHSDEEAQPSVGH
eukprot:scaffold56386_cov68-Phaeocystis_antarctica.AAC.3